MNSFVFSVVLLYSSCTGDTFPCNYNFFHLYAIIKQMKKQQFVDGYV